MASPSLSPAELTATAALPELLRELARRGVQRSYRKGMLLIEEGDRADTLFIILAGRLRAYSRHATNEREITYGIYGPGDYVGEMGLDGGLRSASVEVTEACTCVRIERPTLEAFIAEYPAFAFELLERVIRRARAMTEGLKQMALNDVYGRIKGLLESLATVQPDGTRALAEHLTHREIAERLGCGREMVSRILKDLEKGGHVRPRRAPQALLILRELPERW